MKGDKRTLYLGLRPPENLNIVHLPLIEIVPHSFTLDQKKEFFNSACSASHMLFTSQTAVALWGKLLQDLCVDSFEDKPSFAIGKKTAVAMKQIGFKQITTAQNESLEGVIAELEKAAITTLFWPHSSLSRKLLHTFALEKGFVLDAPDFYTTRLNVDVELPDLYMFDEIVFTSPTTVEAFFSLNCKIPPHIVLKPIGPVTSEVLNFFRNSVDATCAK